MIIFITNNLNSKIAMSKIHESLKANQEEILAALPEELHADFKKELEMPPVEEPALSGDAEIEAIKAELFANPSVDENLAAEELKEISAPGKVAPLTEAEAKAEEEALLAEVKAGISSAAASGGEGDS
jgi:hypothetical protein